jgi:hypothetical protein
MVCLVSEVRKLGALGGAGWAVAIRAELAETPTSDACQV